MTPAEETYWIEVMTYGAVLSGRCSSVEDGVRLAMAISNFAPDEDAVTRVANRIKVRNERVLQQQIAAETRQGQK